ncbi:annexin A5-like [Diadema antillarum]|uniref:annexin A5-like n=1 Tax=Diadema antillarum TaxID=105358 RepID=UPI003A8488EE
MSAPTPTTESTTPVGTVTAADPFDKDADAEALKNAMAGFGTDEDAINKIMTKRSNAQRQEIAAAYKTKYTENLIDCLKDELSGDYRLTVSCMLDDPALMLAKFVNRILKDGDCKSVQLLEIIFPLKPTEVLAVAAAYNEAFSTKMSDDVMNGLDSPFKTVLGNIIAGERSAEPDANPEYAKTDADYLVQTDPKDWQLPNERLDEVFGKASISHLVEVFKQADQQFVAAKKSLVKVVQDSAMSEEQKAAFMVMIKSLYTPIAFYADGLYYSMKGLGTKDEKLIRIIVGRSEIDLGTIKAKFQTAYSTSLADMVTSDTSGDYKNILLGIINADAPPASS